MMACTGCVYTVCMAKKKPKKAARPMRANPWPKRLKALQQRLDLSNDEMASRLGIKARTWMAWKYGERQPQSGSITLIRHLESGKL